MARPRSATAHRKVLDAALDLVAEHGIEGTSMDAVAQKSGVSKATIYKHWADKEALVLEMLADVTCLRNRPKFDSGNPHADMIAVLSYGPEHNAVMRERITAHLVAYSASHPSFGQAWRNMVMEPARRELTHLLQLAIGQGELSPGLDVDLALALLLGPMLYWHIFLRNVPRDRATLAEGIVDAFWRAFGATRSGDAPCDCKR